MNQRKMCPQQQKTGEKLFHVVNETYEKFLGMVDVDFHTCIATAT